MKDGDFDAMKITEKADLKSTIKVLSKQDNLLPQYGPFKTFY
jgi:hypothetical protein